MSAMLAGIAGKAAGKGVRTLLPVLACMIALTLACAAGCAQGGGDGGGEPITVSVKIDGTEGGHGIIYDGKIEVDAGASVYDALLETNVDVSVKSAMGMGVYVMGIDGLMEKEQSPLSGWIYSVNGKVGDVGCGNYTLSDGDVVDWTWHLEALGTQ